MRTLVSLRHEKDRLMQGQAPAIQQGHSLSPKHHCPHVFIHNNVDIEDTSDGSLLSGTHRTTFYL